MTQLPARDQPHESEVRAATPSAQPVRNNMLAIVTFIVWLSLLLRILDSAPLP